MYQTFLRRAMTQEPSRSSLNAEDRVPSQASQCGRCGGESCTATSFSPGTSVFSCRHHSDNVSYSFIRHRRYMTVATDYYYYYYYFFFFFFFFFFFVFFLLLFFVFFFFFFHWHYSPLWALACRTMSFHFFLSATNSLHLLTPST